MSHFVVLVSLDDPDNIDDVMRPFHEYECTGIKEYLSHVDITEKVMKEYKDPYYSKYADIIDFAKYFYGCTPVSEDTDITTLYESYVLLNKDGTVKKIVDVTNPNAKWDWYVVGGRWSDCIIDKNNDKVNYALVKDINFSMMKANNIEDYQGHIDNIFSTICDDHSLTSEEIDLMWANCCAEHSDDDIFSFYEKWHNSNKKDVLTFKEFVEMGLSETDSMKNFFLYDLDNIWSLMSNSLSDIGSWVENASTIPAHALLKDGKWEEMAKIGYFGVTYDHNMKPDQWSDYVEDWIKRLPQDSYLMVVDCHI